MSGPKYAGFILERFDGDTNQRVVDAVRRYVDQDEVKQYLEEHCSSWGSPHESRSVFYHPHKEALWIGYGWDGCGDDDIHTFLMTFGDELAAELARSCQTSAWFYSYLDSSSFLVSATRHDPSGEAAEEHHVDDETEIDAPAESDDDLDRESRLEKQVHEAIVGRLGWSVEVLSGPVMGEPALAPPWLEERTPCLQQKLDDPIDQTLLASIPSRAAPPHQAEQEDEPLGAPFFFPEGVGTEIRTIAERLSMTPSDVMQTCWEAAKGELYRQTRGACFGEPGFEDQPEYLDPPPPGKTPVAVPDEASPAPPVGGSPDKMQLRLHLPQLMDEVMALAAHADRSASWVLQKTYLAARDRLLAASKQLER